MVKRNRKKSKAEPIRSAFCISFSGKNPVVAPPGRCEHRPLQCQREALYRNTNRVPCRGGFHIRPVSGGTSLCGPPRFSNDCRGEHCSPAAVRGKARFPGRDESRPYAWLFGPSPALWVCNRVFPICRGRIHPARGSLRQGKVPGTMRASSPTAATQPPQHSGATSRRAAETRVPSQLVRQSRSATSRHWFSRSIMSARISSSTCPP